MTSPETPGETPAEALPETPAFADLGLADGVLAAIVEAGYEKPSAIQAATIPLILRGRDVMGLAQTGTGKTAAFALPILSDLDLDQRSPQALVLAPTRELALQVCEAFESYASKTPGVKVLPVYGGQGYGPQLTALKRGVHVVVGTPGRIMDHLEKGTLDLAGLRWMVLDEADEMLNMGFAEDVETILAETPEHKQVALFSATMPPAIRTLSKKYLHDPEEVQVKSATKTNANIAQRYLMVSYPQKVDALTRILEVENFEAMIVFVRTKTETESLAEKLRARGFSAAAINGDVAQVQREKTVDQLKDGTLDILVATDVAARGLDVQRISHVVNYDLPTDLEAYVHRIGRTGRAGRRGDAISFVTPRERWLLKAIEKHTKAAPDEMRLPSVDEVNATRLSRFDDSITTALQDTAKIALLRDVVAHYVAEYDVPELDVAAAIAVAMQGDEPLLLEERPEPVRERSGRGERADRAGGRPGRGDREGRSGRTPRESSRSRGNGQPLATYKIAVGKRHKVEPRMIVGALANEGGLRRADFGNISIRPDFSLVELPADLAPETWAALAETRISGKLIELRLDRGARGGGYGGGYKGGSGRGASQGPRTPRENSERGSVARGEKPEKPEKPERPARKPRHKN